MIKTPEELTADWKAGKLDWNKFYYIKLTSGEICIDYANGAYFVNGKPQEITMDYTTDNDVKQILAPVPSYDEYKAIQEELAEHRHYCCCMENEVMRLELAKLEEEIKSLRQKKKEWAYECGKADETNRQLRALLKEGARLLSFEHETYEAENFIKEVNEVIND